MSDASRPDHGVTPLDPRCIPLVRGCFDNVDQSDGQLLCAGWMYVPGKPFERFRLFLDGVEVTAVPLMVREDVGQALAQHPGADKTGFGFQFAFPDNRAAQWIVADVIGESDGEPTGRMSTIIKQGMYDVTPLPDTHLRVRVTNTPNSITYRSTAVQVFSEIRDAAQAHLASPPKRVLDWGCGVGRITAYVRAEFPEFELFGCDIDPEAIAWCRANLNNVEFSVCPPHPPTTYADTDFDFVYAYSVLTHLTEDVQNQWLTELHRIMRPGAIGVLSVHGELAAHYACSPQLLRQLADVGFSDDSRDSNLDGIAPDDYYRGTYHTERYVREKWTKWFTVLDYKVCGVSGLQDLVVIRRE